jgi:hypothetical protein
VAWGRARCEADAFQRGQQTAAVEIRPYYSIAPVSILLPLVRQLPVPLLQREECWATLLRFYPRSPVCVGAPLDSSRRLRDSRGG